MAEGSGPVRRSGTHEAGAPPGAPGSGGEETGAAAAGMETTAETGLDRGGSNLARAMLSTFALTVTNPATLMFFGGLFAGLGGLAGGAGSFTDASLVVAGVVGGSALWWLVLTTLIGLFHARIDEKAMRTINRGSGVLVAIFGLVVLIHLVSKFT